MTNKPKTTFTYGVFVIEEFDHNGTVATFIGHGAGSAGKQYVDWLAHNPGTELEDLRVAVNDIDAALCNYCNQVGDPYDPPSEWNESCVASFRHLCDAYNEWHKNHDRVGEISMKFWSAFEAKLYETKKKLREAEREIELLKTTLNSK